MIGRKTYRCVEGRPAIQMANSDIIKLAKSVNKWAASVAIAKLLDQIPPEKSCKNNCSKRVVIVFMGMYKASSNTQHPSKFGGLSMLQLEFKRLQGNKLRTRSQRKSTHTQQQHWKGGVVGLSMRPIKCTQITFSHFTCRTSQRERRMTYRRCTHKGSKTGWWRARRNNTVLLQFATKPNDWHDITSQKGFSRQGERKRKFRTEKSKTIETRMPIPCHHSWDEQRQVVSMCVPLNEGIDVFQIETWKWYSKPWYGWTQCWCFITDLPNGMYHSSELYWFYFIQFSFFHCGHVLRPVFFFSKVSALLNGIKNLLCWE